MVDINFIDLGLNDYNDTWTKQQELFSAVQNSKKSGVLENHLIFVEHPHVYTLGKSGDHNNLLLDYMQLQAKDAKFVKVDRGGDITYHGPGQLVGYPILNLESFNLSLREYIWNVEEALIKFLDKFDLVGERDPEATGVWLGVGTPLARKIAAIGVRASRYVTMHGFCLNISTDMEYYKHINPCGITDKSVTSLNLELGRELDFGIMKELVLESFLEQFKAEVL